VVPQVHLRKPFLNDRFVPYVIAGAGVSFLRFHDPREATFGHQTDIEGNTFTVTGGAGIEYFVSDNVTLGIEGRYFWLQPVSGKVDGHSVDVNLSAPAFTWGLRACTDKNHPRPLADVGPKSPGRFYFGVRAGDAVFTDDQLVPGVTFGADSSFNQTAGLLADVNWVYSWNHKIQVDNTINGRGDFSTFMFRFGCRVYLFDRDPKASPGRS
jgi:hypothetical protein